MQDTDEHRGESQGETPAKAVINNNDVTVDVALNGDVTAAEKKIAESAEAAADAVAQDVEKELPAATEG